MWELELGCLHHAELAGGKWGKPLPPYRLPMGAAGLFPIPFQGPNPELQIRSPS